MMPSRLRNGAWSVGDQALSSLSNFALSIVAAHALTTNEFGAFGVAFICYLLALGISRSLCGEPFIVQLASSRPADQRAACSGMLTASLLLGCLMSVVIAAIALALGGELRVSLLALATILPIVIVQDAWRYAYFGRSAPARAAMLDLVWLIAQLTGFGALFATGHATLAALIVTWGIGAAVCVAAAYLTDRIPLAAREARAWLIGHKDLGLPFAGDFLMQTGAQQLVVFGLVAVAGVGAAGTLRAATVALGPVVMLNVGLGLFTLPEASRARDQPMLRIRKIWMAHTAAVFAVAALTATTVWVVPVGLGSTILADRWEDARSVTPFVALQIATGGAVGAAAICLRAMQQGRAIIRLRLVIAPATIAGGLTGAVLSGVPGMALAIATVNCCAAAAMWRVLKSSERHGRSSISAERVKRSATAVFLSDVSQSS